MFPGRKGFDSSKQQQISVLEKQCRRLLNTSGFLLKSTLCLNVSVRIFLWNCYPESVRLPSENSSAPITRG